MVQRRNGNKEGDRAIKEESGKEILNVCVCVREREIERVFVLNG